MSAPQRYWARGVLFRDVLTSLPADRGVRIDTKMYFPFTTRVAGTCYAGDEAAAAIRSLDLQRTYAFEAMVVQFRGRYYIIVSGATPVVDTTAMVREMQSLSPGADPALTQSALKPIADIVWEVESSHLAYAREKGIPLCELYDPQSVHFPRAMELVRAAIMKHEVEQRAVSSEILAQYVLLALARTCAATNLGAAAKEASPEDIPEKPTAPVETVADAQVSKTTESREPVSSPIPVAEGTSEYEEPIPLFAGIAEESEPPSQTTEEEAEPSFWQRWKARREQKRAEAEREAEERKRLAAAERERAAAEKARLEEEQRQQEEARTAEKKRIAEEKKRAKEEARRKREEEKAEAERKKKEARDLEEARKAEEAERLAAENERKAFEAALREKEERERMAREKALAEVASREREEAARKREAEERARLEREAAARQQAEEQQRAIEEAARKRAEAEKQARDRAVAEAERRAAETQPSQPAVVAAEPEPPQPSWWERFKERRRLAREEAEKRRKAWDEFLKQEEERLRAEKEAKRKERERLAEEKRRAKEETARQREAAAQVEKQRNIVLPPPADSEPTDRPSKPVQPEKPLARPTTPPMPPPAPAPVLPPQAPAVATAPVLPATVQTARTERVEIDLSAEPPSSALSPETIQRLRQDEEAHYKRFLEEMRRETERQERLRKQLEREMERQMRR